MDKINIINTNNTINTSNLSNITNNTKLINKDIDKIKIENNLIVKDIKEIKKHELSNNSNEIKLDNLSFGFNTETKDFYVKVKRGNVETQYPTNEMMKLKSFLQNLNEN